MRGKLGNKTTLQFESPFTDVTISLRGRLGRRDRPWWMVLTSGVVLYHQAALGVEKNGTYLIHNIICL